MRALASDRRLLILAWLKDPKAHFPDQVDGDLVWDGVCGLLIAEKLGVSQPTVSEHLKILSQSALLTSKRIKQWTFTNATKPPLQKTNEQLLQKSDCACVG